MHLLTHTHTHTTQDTNHGLQLPLGTTIESQLFFGSFTQWLDSLHWCSKVVLWRHATLAKIECSTVKFLLSSFPSSHLKEAACFLSWFWNLIWTSSLHHVLFTQFLHWPSATRLPAPWRAVRTTDAVSKIHQQGNTIPQSCVLQRPSTVRWTASRPVVSQNHVAVERHQPSLQQKSTLVWVHQFHST